MGINNSWKYPLTFISIDIDSHFSTRENQQRVGVWLGKKSIHDIHFNESGQTITTLLRPVMMVSIGVTIPKIALFILFQIGELL